MSYFRKAYDRSPDGYRTLDLTVVRKVRPSERECAGGALSRRMTSR
jgi:hypothetical protein